MPDIDESEINDSISLGWGTGYISPQPTSPKPTNITAPSSTTPTQYTDPWKAPSMTTPTQYTDPWKAPSMTTPSQYTQPWASAPPAPSATTLNGVPVSSTPSQYTAPATAPIHPGGSITNKADLFEQKGTTQTTQTAPVAITPAQKEANDAQFYASLQAAKDAAKAGDPTALRNFDNMFGITRPEAEYSQSFYYGSTPNEQINMINNMPISQEMKTKVIAENLAIQAGARDSDSVDNIIAWFNAGGPTDPRTDAFLSTPQNRIAVVNATNLSQQAKVNIITEILSGNPDTVVNMVTYHGVHGLGQSPSAANWASSATPQNQIAVVNATNISQDFKNKVIAEIQAGSNTSDSVYDKISWFERGNQPSAGALAILNPPPPAPVVEPTTPPPSVVVEEPQSESSPNPDDSNGTNTSEPPLEFQPETNESAVIDISQPQSGSSEIIEGEQINQEQSSGITENNTIGINENVVSGNSSNENSDQINNIERNEEEISNSQNENSVSDDSNSNPVSAVVNNTEGSANIGTGQENGEFIDSIRPVDSNTAVGGNNNESVAVIEPTTANPSQDTNSTTNSYASESSPTNDGGAIEPSNSSSNLASDNVFIAKGGSITKLIQDVASKNGKQLSGQEAWGIYKKMQDDFSKMENTYSMNDGNIGLRSPGEMILNNDIVSKINTLSTSNNTFDASRVDTTTTTGLGRGSHVMGIGTGLDKQKPVNKNSNLL